jgi:hypothetical protein
VVSACCWFKLLLLVHSMIRKGFARRCERVLHVLWFGCDLGVDSGADQEGGRLGC